MSMTASEWVSAGKPGDTTTPIAAPAAPAAPVAPPTPPAPVPPALPASVVAAPPVAPPEQPRDPQGRFVAPGQPAPETPAAPQQPNAEGEQAVKMIEFTLDNGEKVAVPANAKLPWKRGNEEGFATAEEIASSPFFERDYRIKTSALQAEKRQWEADRRVEQAAVEAERSFIQQQIEWAQKSLGNPDEQVAYDNFRELYATNPHFKGIVDKALRGHIADAVDAERSKIAEEEAVSHSVAEAQRWISELAQRHPELDPDRLRATFAAELKAERVDLTYEALEQIAKRELAQVSRLTSPLQNQLAEMQKQIEALKGANRAAAHNANTDQQIAAALNPVGVPAGGAPVTPVPQKRTLSATSLDARTREWAKA